MQRLSLALLVVITGMLLCPSVQAKRTEGTTRIEAEIRSKIGVSNTTFEHQPWLDDFDRYDYNQLNSHTSQIRPTAGCVVTILRGSYSLSTELELGRYSFSNGGTSSLRWGQIELGVSPSDPNARARMGLFIGYSWSRIGNDRVDSLFLTHTTGAVIFGALLASSRDASLRWRFRCSGPAVVITHLFNGKDLPEKELAGMAEFTMGYRPRAAGLYFDVGYHFWVVDHPIEVRHHELVNSLLTIRHGLLFSVGFIH